MLRKVKEASYLTAENHSRYRAILRYFYIQHNRMRDFIFPEEIYKELKKQENFSNYEEESLHLDLNQLVNWGNLVARQEMGNSRTIEEYKKKRFRYQPTPYTIEFERMLIEMENKEESFGGSLERTQFDRVYQLVQEIEKVVLKEKMIKNEEANQLWEDVQTFFQQIRQNTADYIAYINSEEVEERMQTEQFLVYKDQFTKYLSEFIRAMQSTSEQIKSVLSGIAVDELYAFFEQVWSHKSQARLEEIDVSDESRPFEEYTGRWQAIQQWFRGSQAYGKSESDMLLDRTSEAIRKITQVVQRMGERHQNFQSRREEYLYLAQWFDQLEDVEEAHQLYASAFGVDHTRHYQLGTPITEDIYEEEWLLPPEKHITKPTVTYYREKTSAKAVVNRSKERKEAQEMYLREKQKQQEAIEKYMSNDVIKLGNLGIVDADIRNIFLSWIGQAMGQGNQTIQTDLGIRVKVTMNKERIVLRGTDGDLDMPNVTFERVDEKGRSPRGD